MGRQRASTNEVRRFLTERDRDLATSHAAHRTAGAGCSRAFTVAGSTSMGEVRFRVGMWGWTRLPGWDLGSDHELSALLTRRAQRGEREQRPFPEQYGARLRDGVLRQGSHRADSTGLLLESLRAPHEPGQHEAGARGDLELIEELHHSGEHLMGRFGGWIRNGAR